MLLLILLIIIIIIIICSSNGSIFSLVLVMLLFVFLFLHIYLIGSQFFVFLESISTQLSSLCSTRGAVPTPPTFFTKVVNSSSVQVLWELPTKAGKAEGFKLSYRRVPRTVFQGPIQLPCHINAHTITDLGECLRPCFLSGRTLPHGLEHTLTQWPWTCSQ